MTPTKPSKAVEPTEADRAAAEVIEADRMAAAEIEFCSGMRNEYAEIIARHMAPERAARAAELEQVRKERDELLEALDGAVNYMQHGETCRATFIRRYNQSPLACDCGHDKAYETVAKFIPALDALHAARAAKENAVHEHND